MRVIDPRFSRSSELLTQTPITDDSKSVVTAVVVATLDVEVWPRLAASGRVHELDPDLTRILAVPGPNIGPETRPGGRSSFAGNVCCCW